MRSFVVRRVYIETSVVSYLVARDSRDSTVLGRQNSTREWWRSQKSYYELFVSEVVLEEAGERKSFLRITSS